MAGFRCFWACWESFVPVGPGGGCCWESFVPVEPGGGCCRESFLPGEWWIGGGTGKKFSLLGVVVVEPGKSSPCALEMAGFRCFWACRESFVPVGPVRGRAGRVLYRLGPGAAVAGRVLYRVSGGLVLEAGENSPCSREMAGFRCFWACWESFVPGEWWIGVGSGRKFSLLGCVVVEPGENSPCSREMAGFRCFWACWESFVPVGPGGGCCRESFVPVGPVRGARWGRVCCVEPR